LPAVPFFLGKQPEKRKNIFLQAEEKTRYDVKRKEVFIKKAISFFISC
jgi:hypothetical protein